MTDKILSQAAMIARARERFDCFMECVEHGRDTSDVLGLLKVRVRSAKEKAPPGKSTATWFPLPSVRPGRVVVGNKRIMHIQIMTSGARTAADVDRYATEAREDSRTDTAPGLMLYGGEPGAAATAIDTYATRDRTAPGDRSGEQVITNMPSTSDERAPIWNQIDRHEFLQHKAGLDRINVHREAAPEFWAHVASHPDCPTDFRRFLQCKGRHHAAGILNLPPAANRRPQPNKSRASA